MDGVLSTPPTPSAFIKGSSRPQYRMVWMIVFSKCCTSTSLKYTVKIRALSWQMLPRPAPYESWGDPFQAAASSASCPAPP